MSSKISAWGGRNQFGIFNKGRPGPQQPVGPSASVHDTQALYAGVLGCTNRVALMCNNANAGNFSNIKARDVLVKLQESVILNAGYSPHGKPSTETQEISRPSNLSGPIR